MKSADTAPFHVKFSKTKALFAIPLYLVFGLIILLAGFGLLALAYTDETPNFAMMFLASPVMLLFGGLMIWFAVHLFMSIRDDKSIGVITVDGFSGRRYTKWCEFPWTPTTMMSRYKGVVILRNPPVNPTLKERLSDLWSPKHGVGVTNAFSAQSLKDVEAAVARLNPYYEDESSFSASHFSSQ